MNFKNLRTDNSAVSPVIGVILMVAITVILAAVIGTFVLNLGNQVQTTAPSASFTFDEDSNDVIVTHDGGDSIPQSNLKVTVSGDNVTSVWDGGSDVSAGSQVTINPGNGGDGDNDLAGDTVRVIWTSDNGENSQILSEYTPS